MTRVIDLHVHAKLSKRFPLSLDSVRASIAQARRVKLDGFALMEHFHTTDFWGLYETLSRVYQYREGVLVCDHGFRVLTGAELSMREGADLLVLAPIERLRRFDESLPLPATLGYKPVIGEAIAAARTAGALLIGAHMFRPKKELANLGLHNLRYLNAVELNGKDQSGAAQQRLREVARGLRLPVVAGSDAHFWPQVGIRATVFDIPEISQAAVADAIRRGATATRSLPYGPLAVRISGAVKRWVKAREIREGRLTLELPVSIAPVQFAAGVSGHGGD